MKLNYLKYSILNNIFIIACSLILLLLSLNYYVVTIIYILFNLYIYKKDKNLFLISIILSIIVLLIFLILKYYQNYLINNFDGTIRGKIISIENTQYYQKIIIKYKYYKVVIKDYDFFSCELGDSITVNGNKSNIDLNHIPNGFNYNKYFYNNLYLLEVKASNITINKHQFSIYVFNKIINDYLCKYFNGQSLVVLKGFILGDTSLFSSSLTNNLTVNGIIHLFAISGSHIILIISFLDYILKKYKKKNKIMNIILFFYLVITKFSISISRAIGTYYLSQFFKYKKINISSLDNSCIIFILFIIMNPYLMYNLGFVLSFMSAFLIILISSYLQKVSNIKSMLIITIIINIFTFPLTINMNNEFNLLCPLINVIMILLVEGIIIPFSFLVFIFPIFSIIYDNLILGFIELNSIIVKTSYNLNCVITIRTISDVVLLLYYGLLILLIINYSNKKIFKLLIIFFVFYTIIILPGYLSNENKIVFLDLYNGEATFIKYKKEIILIDTGEGYNNELSSYLKSEGITKIDYLFITHNHNDHNGEAINIINNFKVENVIVSEFDNSSISNMKKTIKIKKGITINTKHLQFECLSPSHQDSNENNNSLVLYTEIEGVSFLFTGDIEEEVEKNLNIIYNIDILKVAHHGSNTSSSVSFLKKINPKYCIIMSGRKNIFSFPSNEIINRLQSFNTKVYCTKDCYTITLKIKNKKCIFDTLKGNIKMSINN